MESIEINIYGEVVLLLLFTIIFSIKRINKNPSEAINGAKGKSLCNILAKSSLASGSI